MRAPAVVCLPRRSPTLFQAAIIKNQNRMGALSHPSVRRALLKPSPAAPSDLVPANRRACHLSTTHFTFRPRSRRARCPYCEPPIPRRLTPTGRAAAWPRRGWCPRRARKKAPRPRNKAPYRTRRRSPTSAQCRLDPRSVGSALRTPQGSGWGRCADVGGRCLSMPAAVSWLSPASRFLLVRRGARVLFRFQ